MSGCEREEDEMEGANWQTHSGFAYSEETDMYLV